MSAPLPADFERCFRFTLGREGGFVDDPRDAGGATNHGISLRYAMGKGRVLDLDHDGDVDAADIRLVTPNVARTMYRLDFWRPVGGDGLPGPLGLVAFDSAVLCGAARAPRWLQQALGVPVDGAIGPITLAAARQRDLAETIADLLLLRETHLRQAPTFSAHGKGWLRRVMYLAMAAGVWAAEARAA
jgi:lysozyme family protein